MELRHPRGAAALDAACLAAASLVPLVAAAPPPPDPPANPDGGDKKPEPEKLTVNLNEPTADALYEILDVTGDTKTVVTRRALQYFRLLIQAVRPNPRTGKVRGRIIIVEEYGRGQTTTRELTIVP